MICSCGFHLHSPRINNVECLFMCSFSIDKLSLVKCLSNPIPIIYEYMYVCIYIYSISLRFESSLYILDTNPLSDTCFANIFSQSVVYLCTSFVSLKEQKEKFWWSYIYLFIVITHNFGVVSNLCLVKLWFFFSFLTKKNFLATPHGMWDLVSWPGTKPHPLHW